VHLAIDLFDADARFRDFNGVGVDTSVDVRSETAETSSDESILGVAASLMSLFSGRKQLTVGRPYRKVSD
jgi:hypothetical protein